MFTWIDRASVAAGYAVQVKRGTGDAPLFVEKGEAGIVVMMLCGINLRFNLLGGMRGCASDKRRSEDGCSRQTLPHRSQRWLWVALPIGNAKGPIPASAPARCHSSVHEKSTTPAQPQAKLVRTCQSRTSACFNSPLRMASNPTSLMTRGRSPAMFSADLGKRGGAPVSPGRR